MTRPTSASSALSSAGCWNEPASRINASSCCTMIPFFCCDCGLGAGDASESGADGHADAGGIAFTEHIAGHHFAGDEQIAAGLPIEVNGRFPVNLEPQVGKIS